MPGDTYEPVKAGSIDGTDVDPHDRGIKRAMNAVEVHKYKHEKDPKIKGEASKTLYVARLDMSTTDETLKKDLWKVGKD